MDNSSEAHNWTESFASPDPAPTLGASAVPSQGSRWDAGSLSSRGDMGSPGAPTEVPPSAVAPFWDSPLNHGISVLVVLALSVAMLGLGCTVEVSQLGAHIRRPIGVLLALISQFIIMPMVAFLMALIFSLDEVAAIAVLLCGCCPGGNLSNIMSVLVNGDMNLSIIMTTSSTLLALLLMPLCLWIYSRAWINTPLVQFLPMGAVSLTLISTLLPIGLGVFVRYRYNRAADLLVKFLEQKYGYYHCKECNIRWESAYVWCVQGTNKVYFRQFCRTCQKSFNPYRVEDITCQTCKQTRCTCPVKLRHVDPKRPHRQDLCGRCKGKRLSCDSTFSFKYII